MPLTSPAEAAVMSASSAEMLATVGEEACAAAALAAVGDPEGTGGAEEAAFSESAEAGGAALSNRARPLRSARRGMGQRGRLPGEKAEELIAEGELCSVYLNRKRGRGQGANGAASVKKSSFAPRMSTKGGEPRALRPRAGLAQCRLRRLGLSSSASEGAGWAAGCRLSRKMTAGFCSGMTLALLMWRFVRRACSSTMARRAIWLVTS